MTPEMLENLTMYSSASIFEVVDITAKAYNAFPSLHLDKDEDYFLAMSFNPPKNWPEMEYLSHVQVILTNQLYESDSPPQHTKNSNIIIWDIAIYFTDANPFYKRLDGKLLMGSTTRKFFLDAAFDLNKIVVGDPKSLPWQRRYGDCRDFDAEIQDIVARGYDKIINWEND